MNMAINRYLDQEIDYQEESQGVAQRGGVEKINRPSRRPAHQRSAHASSATFTRASTSQIPASELPGELAE